MGHKNTTDIDHERRDLLSTSLREHEDRGLSNTLQHHLIPLREENG